MATSLEMWITYAEAQLARLICPYGDPICPCKDGDACHYEGENPMTPPMKMLEQERDAAQARVLEKVEREPAYLSPVELDLSLTMQDMLVVYRENRMDSLKGRITPAGRAALNGEKQNVC